MKTMRFPDGATVPALDQGTWMMAEKPDRRSQEIAALRAGVELGLTLIDTAEMYADGQSERFVGEAIEGIRDQMFRVGKAYPQNASRQRLARACEASLQRLGTDRLDLYLLHWRETVPLADTVEAMEQLVAAGTGQLPAQHAGSPRSVDGCPGLKKRTPSKWSIGGP